MFSKTIIKSQFISKVIDFNFCYIFIKFVFLTLKCYFLVREIHRNKNSDENHK